ncbi:hypothetical protein QQS21_006002 [Conoideocrella luteorostrata]|uniref:Aminoglycoside phosphotransferase domain-containing protein n=1 Tax=Conoideocrella luteorostrata TaxID=1105319 RepID=A0AAJ0CPD8_9HYPO|nr:hypothetical protein QQS21_006002 [Conoideocrella luteorostrata]
MEVTMPLMSRQRVSDFFLKTAAITQQQCDKVAERITGGSIHPAPVQGLSSYTVLSSNGAFVVQFRAALSPLNLDRLKYIQQTYGRFVPRHGISGRLKELHVYTMYNVGGIPMYIARDQLHQHHGHLLRQTVQDFARFFALAWHNTPSYMSCPDRTSLFSQYSWDLSRLAEGLPRRYRRSLDYLIANLPKLFVEDWPLVLHHCDLLQDNIHVNPGTGEIVGICDWEDAAIAPFGMSIGNLETMLVTRSTRNWCYHANQQVLRDLFWDTLYDAMGQVSEAQKELIGIAALTGIFLQNGFDRGVDGNRVPASEGSVSLEYLELVTLLLDRLQLSNVLAGYLDIF